MTPARNARTIGPCRARGRSPESQENAHDRQHAETEDEEELADRIGHWVCSTLANQSFAHRGRHDSDQTEEEKERLPDVLAADRSEEHGLARQVGAGRVELLADERVVARRDEERKLRGIRGSRDLDGSRRLAGLGHDERLREEVSDEEIGRRALAHHAPRNRRRVGELIVGHVVHHLLAEQVRPALRKVGRAHRLTRAHVGERVAVRAIQIGAVACTRARHVAEDREGRDGLDVAHAGDSGDEEHLASQLRGASDGFVDRVQARDAPDVERLPHPRELDRTQNQGGEEDRGDEGIRALRPEPVVVGPYGFAHDGGAVDRRSARSGRRDHRPPWCPRRPWSRAPSATPPPGTNRSSRRLGARSGRPCRPSRSRPRTPRFPRERGRATSTRTRGARRAALRARRLEGAPRDPSK
jgi:hypothetical protein